jgi:hypothetical protein
VKFTARLRRNEVADIIGHRAHIEEAKASDLDNVNYCSKEGRVIIQKGETLAMKLGLPQKKLKQDRWIEILSDAKTRQSEEFQEKCPDQWLIRRSAIEKVMIESAAAKARIWNGILPQKTVWIWGKPGIGNNRWAQNQASQTETYRKDFNRWWNGYRQGPTKLVIVEDYPATPTGDILSHLLKILGDRSTFQGEVKNGGLTIIPGTFWLIVTNNDSIEQCFSREEDREAIRRRFDEREMTRETASLVEQLTMQ